MADPIERNPAAEPTAIVLVERAASVKAHYVAKLQAMDDEALYQECRSKIWLSAYAISNPRATWHWMCDAAADECRRRGKPEIYDRAHAAEVEAAGG